MRVIGLRTLFEVGSKRVKERGAVFSGDMNQESIFGDGRQSKPFRLLTLTFSTTEKTLKFNPVS